MQAGIKESETPTCVVFAGGLAIIFGLWFLRIGFYMICGLVGLVLGILLVPAVIVGLLRLLS